MAYFPGWGHLNSYLARGGGNLNTNFPKIQMPGGMLKLRFDWYITFVSPAIGATLQTFLALSVLIIELLPTLG